MTNIEKCFLALIIMLVALLIMGVIVILNLIEANKSLKSEILNASKKILELNNIINGDIDKTTTKKSKKVASGGGKRKKSKPQQSESNVVDEPPYIKIVNDDNYIDLGVNERLPIISIEEEKDIELLKSK